jgi:hypothetical protein
MMISQMVVVVVCGRAVESSLFELTLFFCLKR